MILILLDLGFEPIRIPPLVVPGLIFAYASSSLIHAFRHRRLLRQPLLDLVLPVSGLILIVLALVFEWIGWENEYFSPMGLQAFLFLAGLVEAAKVGSLITTFSLGAARVIIYSFSFLIFFGAVLLSFPGATWEGISITDAVFMAVSAVCVTGLSVCSLSQEFTFFGQTIILTLIQLGGLGIMTFTSFFGSFFRGERSVEQGLLLSRLNHTNNLNQAFVLLRQVVVITLLMEFLGACLLYISLPGTLSFAKIYTAIFHSISAFCNAGFSTYDASLYDPTLRDRTSLHLSVAFLFVIGGLGFPILSNGLKYLSYLLTYYYKQLILNIPHPHRKIVIDINTTIVLITTAILLGAGTLVFFFLEKGNTLSDLSLGQRFTTAFFEAATPRTAGFNNFDLQEMGRPALLLTCILMWIGASPASTGGGVKTTTLAVAVLAMISFARRKERIEMKHRWISEDSVKRAFIILSASLVFIGSGIAALALTEENIPLKLLLFECISAFSTVGLSLGITAELSPAGKWVLIFLMFSGRVGSLTLLLSLFRKAGSRQYRYPEENILIN
jgi:Trk-type K+ transport system membrane component